MIQYSKSVLYAALGTTVAISAVVGYIYFHDRPSGNGLPSVSIELETESATESDSDDADS